MTLLSYPTLRGVHTHQKWGDAKNLSWINSGLCAAVCGQVSGASVDEIRLRC